MQYLLLKDLMIYLFLSDYMNIIEDVSNAIIKASTNLSEDKFNALKKAISVEDNENALWALNQILENYKVASKTKFPLCDDTGIPHVIIEIGEKREITGELIAQINEGIERGLNNLPARPMAVKGNDVERIEQSKGLYNRPGQMKAASFLIDSFSDDSTYKRNISPDTLNIHFILEGGGPEIRAKTYRVYHKRSIVYGNLDSQSDLENYVTQKLNETNIGPLGFGGKTTVLGSFVNVGNQRASGVRIVSVRPSCFVEPRVATLHL